MPIASWSGGATTPTASGMSSGRISAWNTPVTQTLNKVLPVAKAQEQSQLKQQLKPINPNTIPDVSGLKASLKAGTITQPQFLQRFAQVTNAPTTTSKAQTLKNIISGGSQGILQGEQGIGQSLLKIPATLAATGKEVLTGKPQSINLTPREAILTGTRDVQGVAKQAVGADTGGKTGAAKAAGEFAFSAGTNLLPFIGSGKALGIVKNAAGASNIATKEAITNAATKAIADRLSTDNKTPLPSSGKPPVVGPKSVPAPVKTQINPAGQGTKAVLGQEGSIAPGQVVADTKAMLQKHQAVNKASGNISEDFAKNQGAAKDVKLDTANVLKNRTTISAADKQTLQDFRDSKAAGLKPEPLPTHLQEADANITALNKAAQVNDAAKARLTGDEFKAITIESRNPETYTHRIAQGKGSNLELTARGDRENPLSVSSLSKTTSGSKKQVYHAITDEEGNRRIIAVKNNILKDETGRKITQNKLVTAIDEGGKTNEKLGSLNLKSKEDFLNKEVKPYKNQLSKLQKEAKSLSAVRTKEGIPQGRVNALSKKVENLRNQNLFGIMTRSEARALERSHIQLEELLKVKNFKNQSNVGDRLLRVNDKIDELQNKIDGIAGEYSPDELNDKLFVGKDGKKYSIGQATQSEITKATGQKYYVDPELTSHLNYADSKVALENTRFIENTKKILEDKQLAYKEGETAPKGFETTTNPYFRGYKLQPDLAHQLDDIAGGKKSIAGKAFGGLGRFLRQTIVYLPIKHDFNEGAGYIIDRGLSNWVNPVALVRMGKSLKLATKEVATHGELYRKMLQSGSTLMTADDKELGKVVAKQVQDTLSKPEQIQAMAKSFGMSPVRAYQSVQKITVWDVQDILNIARVNERMRGTMFNKGMSFEDALKATERTNFQYKVPSKVALPGKAGRVVGETLKSDKVYFGAYTYDKFRIAKNILKDTANVSKPREALQAADKLAATVAIAAVLWPLVDKGLQKVTGDKNAHITAPGVASVAELTQKIVQKKATPSAIAGQISVAAPYTLGSQLLGNRDSFTGKQIHDPNASAADKSKSTFNWLEKQLSPIQKLTTAKNASVNKGLSTFLSLAGASLPKSSSQTNKLTSLKFDTLPGVQSAAKELAAKGNTQGAIEAIAKYDQEIIKATQAATKADGKPMPTVDQLKSAGFYYDPNLKTVQSWANPTAKQGTLDTILNTKVTPKKGQIGYKAYTIQQALKAKQTKFTNRANPALNQPVIP